MKTPHSASVKSVSRPSAPGAFIHARGLSLTYGGKTAFSGISLPVATGSITALIGPSGCGKTSFLNCINRLTDLIGGCRTTGLVEVGGVDIRCPNTDVVTLRRRVGMIFQKPNPFPLSIVQNLEFPLREHGVRDSRGRGESAEAALRDVGLWDEVKDRLNSPALALSGGQQQRLCLARALVLKPEALLMDEPCSALDPLSGGLIEELISGMRGRYTVLIVTHNLQQARRIADHAAFFWMRGGEGRLIEHGPAEEIFENPRDELTAAYVSGIRG